MHGARVRAASAGLTELVRDSFRIARVGEMPNQARVVQGRRVREIDGGAESQFGIVNRILAAVVRGQVAGGSRIHCDGDVRRERMGGHCRAAQSHLLLHGEGNQQVNIGGRVFEQFDQRGNAEPVVERLGKNRIPRAAKLRGKPDAVADLRLAVFPARIQPQGIQRDLLLVFFFLEKMDGLHADHRRDAVLPNEHGFARQLRDVYPADGFKLIKAVALVGHDHEADLVHVRGKQDFERVPFRAAFRHEDVSQRVHADLVRDCAHLLEDDSAHLALVTGDGDGVAETLEEAEGRGEGHW